jgi:hypothetical protein
MPWQYVQVWVTCSLFRKILSSSLLFRIILFSKVIGNDITKAETDPLNLILGKLFTG